MDYQLSFCYLIWKIKANLGRLVAQFLLLIWKINPQPVWIIDGVPVSEKEALKHNSGDLPAQLLSRT